MLGDIGLVGCIGFFGMKVFGCGGILGLGGVESREFGS